MKVSVEIPKKEFTPVSLIVTIESEQDLINLYNRVNTSVSEINKLLGDVYPKCTTDREQVLFNALDELMRSNNLLP